ncbi:MAG: hypothetical protein R2764_19500 [Bacteroidales bacterium]
MESINILLDRKSKRSKQKYVRKHTCSFRLRRNVLRSKLREDFNNVNFIEYDAYTNPFIGQIGVNVAPGTDNTSTYNISINTSLGNSFFSSPAAETTISGNLNAFVKEYVIRVLECDEVVSRPSCANPVPATPDHLDRAIVNLIVNHYKKYLMKMNPKHILG